MYFAKCCMFVVTWEIYDMEETVATGSFLTSGAAMSERVSSLSIQDFVIVVEVAGNNDGRCGPERDVTIDDRREQTGIAVKWERFD